MTFNDLGFGLVLLACIVAYMWVWRLGDAIVERLVWHIRRPLREQESESQEAAS